jgi:two-component system invasion response regulator UvrY
MIRVLLADDHAILRQGLKQILADELTDVVFGDAGDAAEAIEQLRQAPWDVLILDITMPGRNGFEVLAIVRRDFPAVRVLVLSSTPEDQLGVRALKAGAAGYLNKQTAPEQLVGAIQQLLAGERFVSKALGQRMAADLGRPASTRALHEALSARELQVCLLMAQGKTIKVIADELSLSAKTISTFRSRVFEKLALHNDIDLAHYVREHALLET